MMTNTLSAPRDLDDSQVDFSAASDLGDATPANWVYAASGKRVDAWELVKNAAVALYTNNGLNGSFKNLGDQTDAILNDR